MFLARCACVWGVVGSCSVKNHWPKVTHKKAWVFLPLILWHLSISWAPLPFYYFWRFPNPASCPSSLLPHSVYSYTKGSTSTPIGESRAGPSPTQRRQMRFLKSYSEILSTFLLRYCYFGESHYLFSIPSGPPYFIPIFFSLESMFCLHILPQLLPFNLSSTLFLGWVLECQSMQVTLCLHSLNSSLLPSEQTLHSSGYKPMFWLCTRGQWHIITTFFNGHAFFVSMLLHMLLLKTGISPLHYSWW